MDLQQLVLRISGDSTGATNALNSVGAATNKFGSIVKTIIAGAAVAAMVKWTETTINLGVEAEKAGALLDATMKHTLNSTNEQVAACKSWAENQEKVNHFDAEELMAQLDKGIVKYGDLGTAQVAVSAAQEVARLKGIDVASAYSLVEQASNGMARSLKQFGIEAKGGTTQLEYLQQILDKTAGSTEAYNKTTAGMIGAMKQSYEVMRETLGQALLPIVNTLMTQLSPIIENMTQYILDNMPQIQSAIVTACGWIEKAFATAGKVISGVVDGIKWVLNNGQDAASIVKNGNPWSLGNIAKDYAGLPDATPSGMGGFRSLEGAIDTPMAPITGTGKGRTAIRGVADDYIDLSVAAIDSGIAATKASTAGADAAKKLADAAKAAAEAIKQARQGISDKIYALTHTDQQTEQRALDQEYAANLVASKDIVASKTLYVAESKALVQKYADAAKAIYQTVSDKIYTLTHTDVENAQHALDQELAANLKSGVDKLAAETLYHDECKKLEDEQTKKVQDELDKRLAAQQRYNDAVANATKSLTDQIYAWTHTAQQKEASDIALQAATAFASGVAPATINKYVSAATSNMYSEAGPAGTSSGAIAAVGQYLAGPLKKLNDGIDTLIGVTGGVASGVGQAINGMGGGGRMARAI